MGGGIAADRIRRATEVGPPGHSVCSWLLSSRVYRCRTRVREALPSMPVTLGDDERSCRLRFIRNWGRETLRCSRVETGVPLTMNSTVCGRDPVSLCLILCVLTARHPDEGRGQPVCPRLLLPLRSVRARLVTAQIRSDRSREVDPGWRYRTDCPHLFRSVSEPVAARAGVACDW
jgi:hypothetical protein